MMTFALLLLTAPALACEPVAVKWDMLAANAKTAFVGTVTTVENGKATFTIEKNFRKGEGNSFDAEIIHSTCGIEFTPGQRWLYLGNDASSGSLMLMSEYGVVRKENVDLVKSTFGDFPADGSEIKQGTLERSCAPWDGAAFAIQLDNGVGAYVYASPSDLDKKGEGGVLTYQSDGKPEQGHGSIVQCPKLREGQAENLPCRAAQGTIAIGTVTPTDVTGYIEIADGPENHRRFVFHVKRVNKQVFCG
ncbi:MAG TPA: hypothetical protein VL625_02865 [Patescibacteria group bacterium]|nr:hypothetical protein [Patescibacteria group bacterium]